MRSTGLVQCQGHFNWFFLLSKTFWPSSRHLSDSSNALSYPFHKTFAGKFSSIFPDLVDAPKKEEFINKK